MRVLALFFTYGITLQDWENNGSLDREIDIINRLLSHYEKIYLVTYGRNDNKFVNKLPANVIILPKKYQVPNLLYSLLLPFAYPMQFREVSVIKTNQVLGSWSAVLTKWRYQKKLYLRSGYTLSMHLSKLTSSPRWLGFALRLIERFAYKNSNASSVTTEAQQKYLERSFTSSNIQVVPNGINTDLFHPESKTQTNITELLFVGRLHPEKNLIAMLNALKGVNDVHLTIIGKGPEELKIQQLIKAENLAVDIIPSVPNHQLPLLYNRADLYLQTSLYEGNPKTILEAMSCGLPCLCSDVPGIQEIITHKENGFLCDITSDSIRDSLKELLADHALRTHLSKQAREYICAHYSLDSTFKREIDLQRTLW